MFDLVNWFALMCCWCCDRKSKDEEEYEISERDRQRQELKVDLGEGGSAVQGQAKKPPQLAHAPQLSQSSKRYAGITSRDA